MHGKASDDAAATWRYAGADRRLVLVAGAENAQAHSRRQALGARDHRSGVGLGRRERGGPDNNIVNSRQLSDIG